eukprot:scaffold339175_cov29-Prasinocladus_malaysianus.AAC.1
MKGERYSVVQYRTKQYSTLQYSKYNCLHHTHFRRLLVPAMCRVFKPHIAQNGMWSCAPVP